MVSVCAKERQCIHYIHVCNYGIEQRKITHHSDSTKLYVCTYLAHCHNYCVTIIATYSVIVTTTYRATVTTTVSPS